MLTQDLNQQDGVCHVCGSECSCCQKITCMHCSLDTLSPLLWWSRCLLRRMLSGARHFYEGAEITCFTPLHQCRIEVQRRVQELSVYANESANCDLILILASCSNNMMMISTTLQRQLCYWLYVASAPRRCSGAIRHLCGRPCSILCSKIASIQ